MIKLPSSLCPTECIDVIPSIRQPIEIKDDICSCPEPEQKSIVYNLPDLCQPCPIPIEKPPIVIQTGKTVTTVSCFRNLIISITSTKLCGTSIPKCINK